MEKLKIVKIGGKMIDDPEKSNRILDAFSKVEGPKILVHGGASQTDILLERLGIEKEKLDGRRITNKATLDVCVMVYAGLLNKQLVADLSKRNVLALGMTGADLNSITCQKRIIKDIDFGYVGDVEKVNQNALFHLLNQDIALVFCAITHNNQGQLLNTNGDTIAAVLAKSLSENYQVELLFVFDRKGVINYDGKDEKVIKTMTKAKYQQMVDNQLIKEGLIPKMQNGFDAIENGILEVRMGGPEIMIDADKGTRLIAK